MNPVHHIARLLSETQEPPRSADEKRFMKKHEPEIITDPAVGDFFERLRDMGYEPYSRIADVKPEVSKLVYESTFKGETVLGVMEDTQERISLIQTNRVNAYKQPRYTLALINQSGEICKAQQLSMAFDINRSPGMDDYLKKMACDIVGGDRNITWTIRPIDPLDPDTGVPTHRRAQERLVINETYTPGQLKLKDGSSVKIDKKEATLLNKLLDNLNPTNRKKMVDVLVADKSGFEEIIGFAQEYDE